ncbi:MAG: hypothetical protein ACKV0T_30930, partial [Planctomycetales bacterium]
MDSSQLSVPFAQTRRVPRRDALKCGLAAVGLTAAGDQLRAAADSPRNPDSRSASPKRYDVRKSINLWAFPYPERMTLEECLRLAKA